MVGYVIWQPLPFDVVLSCCPLFSGMVLCYALVTVPPMGFAMSDCQFVKETSALDSQQEIHALAF